MTRNAQLLAGGASRASGSPSRDLNSHARIAGKPTTDPISDMATHQELSCCGALGSEPRHFYIVNAFRTPPFRHTASGASIPGGPKPRRH